MNQTSIILVLFSGMGLGLSSFFGFYLFVSKNFRSLSNKLLALLIIALSIRIGKAIFYSLTELPLFVKNIGLAANLAAGPLLYFYVKSLSKNNFQWSSRYYIHFIPFLIYALFSWAIPNGTGDIFWKVSYSFILIQSYTYVGLSIKTYASRMSHQSKNLTRWVLAITFGLLAVWIIYGLVFIQIIPYHIAGAISFSGLMIALLFIAVNKKIILENETENKYSTSKLSAAEAQELLAQIRSSIEHKRLFLDPGLTINKLAEASGISAKLISESINRFEDQNFVGFVNAYRVDEAKKLLLDEKANLKIAAVAYKSGFNSLSVFNQVFKKTTSVPPSKYRNSQING